jgi:hypothetical protein
MVADLVVARVDLVLCLCPVSGRLSCPAAVVSTVLQASRMWSADLHGPVQGPASFVLLGQPGPSLGPIVEYSYDTGISVFFEGRGIARRHMFCSAHHYAELMKNSAGTGALSCGPVESHPRR